MASEEVCDNMIEINMVLTNYGKALIVRDDGCVLCPECKTQIKTGNGGVQNFVQRHQGSGQFKYIIQG
jgi:hypothetical protein